MGGQISSTQRHEPLSHVLGSRGEHIGKERRVSTGGKWRGLSPARGATLSDAGCRPGRTGEQFQDLTSTGKHISLNKEGSPSLWRPLLPSSFAPSHATVTLSDSLRPPWPRLLSRNLDITRVRNGQLVTARVLLVKGLVTSLSLNFPFLPYYHGVCFIVI